MQNGRIILNLILREEFVSVRSELCWIRGRSNDGFRRDSKKASESMTKISSCVVEPLRTLSQRPSVCAVGVR